jgi:uncharacterized repeat protein (TIGR01451 family)
VTFTPPSPVNVTPSSTVSASISFLQTSTAVAGTGSTSALNDTNPANNTATFSVAASAADMSASFVSFPVSAPVGSVVTGTANFVNTNATNTATTAVFSISLTPGLTNVTVTSAVLGTGVYNSTTGLVTFTPPSPVNVTPSSTVSASISFLQTSTAVAGTGSTSALNDTNPANNTATFSVAASAADMSASFASFPASAPVNTVVTGTANFVNTNATNIATTATFTLALSPNLANVTVTSVILGNGVYAPATGIVTFTPAGVVNVPANGTVSASISFIQTSTGVLGTGTTGALNDTNAANNTATFSVTGSAADMSASFANFPASAPVNSVVAGTANFVNTNATNIATTATFTLTLSPNLAGVTVTSAMLGTGVYTPATGIVTFTPAGVINVPANGTVSASISFIQTTTGVVGQGTTNALNDTNATNNTASFSVAGSSSDLSTTFANFPPSAPVNSVVSGSVNFVNTTGSPATTATFTLTLSPNLAGVTVTSPILGAGIYNPVNGIVTFSPPGVVNVPANSTVSASISFLQTSTGVVGTGTSGAVNDINPANNTSTFSVTGSAADMSASFASFPATAPVGSIVTGTANFVNTNATNIATTATFTLTLSPNLANVTVTSALLGTGVYVPATGIVTFSPAGVVNVPAGGTVSASISFLQTSTAVAGTGTTGAVNDINAANNTATFSVTGSAADMSASFAGFPASAPVNSVVVGTANFVNTNATNIATTATFTLTLSPNLSGVTVTSALLGTGVYAPATGIVTFTPAGVVNVPANGTVSASISFVQTTTGVVGQGTTNAVNDTNAANNTASFTVAGTSSDLSATFANFPASAPVNSTVNGSASFVNMTGSTASTATFTLTLSPNLSGVVVTSPILGAGVYNPATGVVTFSPAGVVNVPANSTVSASISFLQTSTGVAGTGTTNAVNDTNATNNTATFSVTGSAADMSASFASFPASAPVNTVVTGTANFVNVNAANVATTATFTLTLSPNLAGVTVTSAILGNGVYAPATGIVTFSPAGVINVAAKGTVSASISFIQTITGVVAQGTTNALNDTNPANNTATVSVTGIAVADLGITKVASSAVGTVGQTINYIITFGNAGPSTAVNVTVTDVLPTGLTLVSAQASIGTINSTTASLTVTLPSMPIGTTGTMTVTAAVGAGAPSSIVNVAAITSQTLDPSTANNSATSTIGKTDSTDLRVTLTVPGNATPGSTITAVIVVTNAGPSPATNVTGTLTLSSNPGSSTATTVLTVFTVPSLPANSSTTTIVSYVVPPAQSVPMSWTATVATTVIETNYANNTATAVTTVALVTNASLSGRVWFDINRNRVFDAGTSDAPLPGFRVELLKVTGTSTVIVGTATTGADGRYTITGQVPGTDYRVRFRDPLGNVIYGTPFNQTTTTQNNNPSTGTNSSTAAISPNQSVVVAGFIDHVTLYVGDNVQEQNLPLDPSGIVYDSVTRTPIPGATVKIVGPAGFDPAIHLLSGTDTQVTPVFGLYQYLFVNNPPSGVYTLQVTPPAGYAPPVAVQGGVAAPQGTYNVPAGVSNIQGQSTAPAVGTNGVGPTGGTGTQYYFQLQFNFPGSGEVFNNHIPLDPLASGAILVNKTGNKTVAEIGDSVQYTIRMRNTTGAPIGNVTLEDLLPAGFRYILQTSRLNGATVTDPLGGVGRALTFNVGTIPANTSYELTYFVRLGVGSQQGDGINRATAAFPGANGVPVRSNTAAYKVSVQGGVFSNEGCIVGKVYVDCDGNFVQNNEGGSREVGIPGVRLVMLDGTWIVTDNEGKYSICGVKAQTQVIKVDKTTLPKGSRLVPSSNRNAGVGDSIFVDMKGGEMHRADFIEGSCSPEVMDQIKARRAQGGAAIPETNKDSPVKPDYRPAELMPAVPGGVR